MAGINFELLQDMIDCVKREVKMRYAVYPARVRNEKISKDVQGFKSEYAKMYKKLEAKENK